MLRLQYDVDMLLIQLFAPPACTCDDFTLLGKGEGAAQGGGSSYTCALQGQMTNAKPVVAHSIAFSAWLAGRLDKLQLHSALLLAAN